MATPLHILKIERKKNCSHFILCLNGVERRDMKEREKEIDRKCGINEVENNRIVNET